MGRISRSTSPACITTSWQGALSVSTGEIGFDSAWTHFVLISSGTVSRAMAYVSREAPRTPVITGISKPLTFSKNKPKRFSSANAWYIQRAIQDNSHEGSTLLEIRLSLPLDSKTDKYSRMSRYGIDNLLVMLMVRPGFCIRTAVGGFHLHAESLIAIKLDASSREAGQDSGKKLSDCSSHVNSDNAAVTGEKI